MPRAVFRADATPQLGGGHVYRCLTLAHVLAAENWTCSFVCNEGAEQIVPWLERSPFQRTSIDASIRETADLLVIDHYGLAENYEKAARSWACRILVIDDLADRPHDADILLDQNIGREPSDYAALVSSKCRLMTGPAYALLRPAFGQKRLAGWRVRNELRRVLVAMGATDPANATGSVLAGLINVSGIEVDVVLGAAASNLNAVCDQVKTFGNKYRIHVEVDDEAMAALIADADLAIAAAGGSAWERCSLGLPSLLVLLADNQRAAADTLVAIGASRALGCVENLAPAGVTAAVRALIGDPDALIEMSRAAAKVNDGLGARRVAAVLSPERSDDGAAVVLRPATVLDSDTVFAWQNIPTIRRYFHEAHPPGAEEHAAWFVTSLNSADRMLNVIEVDRVSAGVLRLDRIGGRAGVASADFFVSILIAPDFEGRGVAKAALRATRRLMDGQRLAAEILDANIASLRAFEASGYRRQGTVHINNGC